MIFSRAAAWFWSRIPLSSRVVNAVLAGEARQPAVAGDLDPDAASVLERARRRSDISDHLLTIHAEAAEVRPRLVVELGTRGGESTFALLRAARRFGGVVVSVDINDCASSAADPAWHFIRGDDVAIAAQFPAWARERGLPSSIDVLFIDTSHEYAHTKAELAAWVPLLAPGGKLILHDTNLRTWFRRRDGSIDAGWDNERGVIRALEEFLGVRFDERRPLVAFLAGWLVRHHPECNGLTVLTRTAAAAANARPA